MDGGASGSAAGPESLATRRARCRACERCRSLRTCIAGMGARIARWHHQYDCAARCTFRPRATYSPARAATGALARWRRSGCLRRGIAGIRARVRVARRREIRPAGRYIATALSVSLARRSHRNGRVLDESASPEATRRRGIRGLDHGSRATCRRSAAVRQARAIPASNAHKTIRCGVRVRCCSSPSTAMATPAAASRG